MSRQSVVYGAVCVGVMLMLVATVAQAQGYVFVTKWGSEGSGDGQFSCPAGIKVDESGNILVADTYNRRIQEFTSNGVFLSKRDSYDLAHGYGPGILHSAVDAAGNTYVPDTYNNCIRKYSADGTLLANWGSEGSGDGQFRGIAGVAVDIFGNVYAADCRNNRIQKLAPDGSFLAKWGSRGPGDGQFWYPRGVTVDRAGNVYVSDTFNNRIQKFAPVRPTPTGPFAEVVPGQATGQVDLNDPVIIPNTAAFLEAIINQPPTAPTVMITPANPTVDDNLRCKATGSVDPNGDAVTYRYQWYRDGKLMAKRTFAGLAATRTKAGETWACVVTPTDGRLDGPTGEATVTILPRP